MSLTLAADTITFSDLTTITPTTIKWAYINGATNLFSNRKYVTDTSVFPFSVALPGNPLDGDYIIIADGYGFWGTYNLTIDRNGKNIAGLSENLICDVNYAKIELVYTNNNWSVT